MEKFGEEKIQLAMERLAKINHFTNYANTKLQNLKNDVSFIVGTGFNVAKTGLLSAWTKFKKIIHNPPIVSDTANPEERPVEYFGNLAECSDKISNRCCKKSVDCSGNMVKCSDANSNESCEKSVDCSGNMIEQYQF